MCLGRSTRGAACTTKNVRSPDEINKVLTNFVVIVSLFPRNTTSKNAFLAVCQTYGGEDIDLYKINEDSKYGGRIGIGRAPVLHRCLNWWKIMRVHAIYHDAFGYLRSNYNIGPGYVYSLARSPFIPNICFLGHLTGILSWTVFKVKRRNLYSSLPF